MLSISGGLLLLFTLLIGYLIHKVLKGGSKATASEIVRSVPGLKLSDPQKGNNEDIAKAGSLHQFLSKLHKDYGEIASFWLDKEWVVSISSEKLFKEHCKLFDRPVPIFKLFQLLVTSSSVQFANGADGRRRRAVYDPAYSHQAVVHDHLPIFIQICKEIMEEFSKMSPEERIPLEKSMFHFSLKSICETSLGKAYHDNDQVNELKELYDLCWNHVEEIIVGKVPEKKEIQAFEQGKDRLFGIIQGVIKERGNVEKGNLLIDFIMSSGASDEVVVADTLTYLIGGSHTTGLMLTWCLYYLARQPDIQERCYKELVDVLGDETIDGRVINDLKYIRQVMDETMRCCQLGPYAARYQDEESELGGYTIPPGTSVIHALGVSMEDEDKWPNPSVFDPDRFEEAPDTYAFVPFGFAGGRKCPGYRFSYMEGYVYLSEFLRKFKVKLAPGQNKEVGKVYGLVTKPSEELFIMIEKR